MTHVRGRCLRYLTTSYVSTGEPQLPIREIQVTGAPPAAAGVGERLRRSKLMTPKPRDWTPARELDGINVQPNGFVRGTPSYKNVRTAGLRMILVGAGGRGDKWR